MSVPFFDLGPSVGAIRTELDQSWERLLDHGGFVGGPEVEEFEGAFAAYCGVAHCVGVGNGTDAIELVLRALDVPPGSEVIVPTNTFVATAAAVVTAGAVPKFVDVDPDSLLLTPAIAAEAISDRTAAIICVHLFGQPCDMDGLESLADGTGLALVEDAAQAHGASWRGRPIGSQSTAATFSFYPGKNLGGLGDGGAVITNDVGLAAKVSSLSRHGRAPADRYVHHHVGRNSRLDTLNAAFLSARLRHLDAENERRREARAWYCQMLPEWLPLVSQNEPTSSNHLMVARTPHRDALRSVLEQAGIATGVHYPIPCHLQSAFEGVGSDSLPIAEQAAAEIVSLPVWGHITEEQVALVCRQINAWDPTTLRDVTPATAP